MHRQCRERFPRHRLQRKLLVSDPGMHHGTCMTHVPVGIAILWWRGKRSRHSRRLRNLQSYVTDKRPMLFKIAIDLCNKPSYYKETTQGNCVSIGSKIKPGGLAYLLNSIKPIQCFHCYTSHHLIKPNTTITPHAIFPRLNYAAEWATIWCCSVTDA